MVVSFVTVVRFVMVVRAVTVVAGCGGRVVSCLGSTPWGGPSPEPSPPPGAWPVQTALRLAFHSSAHHTGSWGRGHEWCHESILNREHCSSMKAS